MPLDQDLADAESSYESYDPSTVRPAPLAPPPSSDAPGDSSEAHAESDVTTPAAVEFDARHREPFMGLMYVGALTDTFRWAGHVFKIRTLTTLENLIVATIAAKYEGTLGQNRAYSVAVVALSIMSVDGEPLPHPYKEEALDDEWAWQRFRYVAGTYYSMTIDAVYEKVLLLESKSREVVTAMGNLSG